ncbi:MAG TPA: hypothetical protein VNI58_02265 [Mariprofundaceae bacterium]|nr:hypothetical protein [Mariprofundaceae bacterium]
MTEQQTPDDERTYWNKRQKKSVLPALLGLIVLCMILAYLLSHTTG